MNERCVVEVLCSKLTLMNHLIWFKIATVMGVQKVAENIILFPPVVAHLSAAAAAAEEEEEAAEALIIQKQK